MTADRRSAGSVRPRADVGYADLLLALDAADGDPQRSARWAAALGFVLDEKPTATTVWPAQPAASLPDLPLADPEADASPPATEVSRPSGARSAIDDEPSLQRPQARLLAVMAIEELPEPERTQPGGPVLDRASCAPARSASRALQPLVPMTRLWPVLRRSASGRHPGPWDVPRILRTMARGEPVRQLPRVTRHHWVGQLWVLQDVGERMRPYQADFDAMVDLLLAQRGGSGLTVWQCADLPSQMRQRLTASTAQRWTGAMPVPPPGTRVLVLSDLGALAPSPDLESAWAHELRQWRKAGLQVDVWMPTSARHVPQRIARCATVRCLQGTAGLRVQKGAHADPAQRVAALAALAAAGQELNDLCAHAVHLGPTLLRDLRLLSAPLAAEPALEGWYWTQAGLQRSTLSLPLSPDVAVAHREALKTRPMSLQLRVLQAMQDHHASHGPSVLATEALIWAAHASAAARSDASVAPVLAAGHDWWTAFSRTLHEVPGALAQARGFAVDVAQRAGEDAAWWSTDSAALSDLWAVSDAAAVPKGLDAAMAGRARIRLLEQGADGRAPVLRLVQHRGDLWLWPVDWAALPRASSPVGPAFAAHGVLLSGLDPSPAPRWVSSARHPQRLAPITPDLSLEVQAGGQRITLGSLRKPPCVDEWGCDAVGLYVQMPALGELPPVRLYPPRADTQTEWPLMGISVPDAPSSYAESHIRLSFGVDFRHGLFADLRLETVIQRFRYMPPGEFWMGSPDDEPERFGNESPRHRVRLTEGYWLADTACTQALWLAVMGGKNPSRFQADPGQPVEQVSWDDVQTFLQRLQPLLPAGCEAVLPTEAQWEYACRAGTQTPFSFGPNVTTEQVNYDGNAPYVDGRKGEYRKKTVPVKSLPANGWGLYEMHGNVWEWCADGVEDGALRRYPKQQKGLVLENPFQPPGAGSSAQRVLRGGSWVIVAGRCRSANRSAFVRVRRRDFVGFRFALKSRSALATVTKDASRQDTEGLRGTRVPAASNKPLRSPK